MSLKAQFLQEARKKFESDKDYARINTQEHFWNFWDQQLAYKDIYSGSDGATIAKLEELHQRSIEHIIPKSELSKFLQNESPRVLHGARTNPFNMAPAHRGVNSFRGVRPLDLDGDEIKEPVSARYFPLTYSHTGIDEEGEWVIPAITRGDIARAILYMIVVYDLPYLTEVELGTLRTWSLFDPPNPTEKQWNEWVLNKFDISNPFISQPRVFEDHQEFLSLFQPAKGARTNNGLIGIVGVKPKITKERVYLENRTNKVFKLNETWTLCVEKRISATEFAPQVELDPSITSGHFIVLPPRKVIGIGFTKPDSLPNEGARITLWHLKANENPDLDESWERIAQVQY